MEELLADATRVHGKAGILFDIARAALADPDGAVRDDQEVSVAALHLLQSCLVYVNTLMLQRVLEENTWRERMTREDVRGLTPLVWGHVSPYGRFDLDMTSRIDLEPKLAA